MSKPSRAEQSRYLPARGPRPAVAAGTAKLLRLETSTWQWLESEASRAGAVLLVLGTYLVLAFDRFGWPDFAPRATVRLMLTGLYGWIWLAVGSWVAVRLAFAIRGSIFTFLRLTGHAHLPLLLVALLIQFVSVMFDISNVTRWPALFVGLFWMPAMLVQAISASSGVSLRRAALAAAVPYAAWAAVVGRLLWRQLGHLL